MMMREERMKPHGCHPPCCERGCETTVRGPQRLSPHDFTKHPSSAIGKGIFSTEYQGPRKSRRDKPSTGLAFDSTRSKNGHTIRYWIRCHVRPTTWSPQSRLNDPRMRDACAPELSMKCIHRQFRKTLGKAIRRSKGL